VNVYDNAQLSYYKITVIWQWCFSIQTHK